MPILLRLVQVKLLVPSISGQCEKAGFLPISVSDFSSSSLSLEVEPSEMELIPNPSSLSLLVPVSVSVKVSMLRVVVSGTRLLGSIVCVSVTLSSRLFAEGDISGLLEDTVL